MTEKPDHQESLSEEERRKIQEEFILLEDQKAEAEDRYHYLFEHALVGLFRMRLPKGIILEANNEAIRLFGYPDFTAMSQKFSLDRDLPGCLAFLEGSQDADSFIVELIDANNISRSLKISVRKYSDNLTIEGAVQDVTLQKKAEKVLENAREQLEDEVRVRTAELRHSTGLLKKEIQDHQIAESLLRDSEECHRAIFENIIDVFFRTDLDGHLTLISPSGCHLLGYAAIEDMIGLNVAEDLYMEPEKRKELLRLARDTGQAHNFEVALRHNNGSPVNVETNIRIIDRDGERVAVEGVFRDIRARKTAEAEKGRLEKQICQTQKMEALGTLAGGIAHDFNNILTIIMGNATLAGFDADEGYSTTEAIQQITIAASRAADLVRQILTFSRQKEQEYALFPLPPLLKEMIKFIRSSMPAGIEIKDHIETSCPAIMAEQTQIYQIILNLCTNSIQAMGEKGILSIFLKEKKGCKTKFGLTTDKCVQLTIGDTGPGIDPKIRERIFEPFFTTKPIGEGTGMGLAVVHGIVLKHNGNIIVESSPGQGCSFIINLPVAETAETAPDEAKTAPPCGNERILLIDDEPDIARIQKKLLNRLGYEVTTRTSAVEALALFRQQPDTFDLVITDQAMPKLTGLELLGEILNIRPEVPVILCTGYSSSIDIAALDKLGVRAMLHKPMVMEKLARVIRHAIDEERSSSCLVE